MHLGIDLGTTRVVVAAADRGNYPVVTFETESSSGCEWYPSLCAFREGQMLTGHAALAVVRDPQWRICRSFKRLIAHARPADLLFGLPVEELMTRFLLDLKQALIHHSNLELTEDEPLDVAISVPANATANQRMLTLNAFQSAGFRVHRMLEEPSAAGLEYAWRRPTDAQVRKRHVAVYDLGGGTFDASLISMGDKSHEVITTGGIAQLGGDDFDAILLDLCLQTLADSGLETDLAERDRLLEICRDEKERFTTATRRLKPDLFGDGREVKIKVSDYEEALRPLIQRTLDTLDTVLSQAVEQIGADIEKNTVVYQVGGGSQLPTVSRMLKDRFGRRVWRSPYAHASVAVGLAIAAEDRHAIRIHNRFNRHFGVWREGEEGRQAIFDPVFTKDTPLPEDQSHIISITRRYRAAHNVGHYRFVECSRLKDDGTPAGEVTPWCDVRFPMVRALCDRVLEEIPVHRLGTGDCPEVEERYLCDANGIIEVELVNLTDGYRRAYRLHGKAV